MKSIPVTFLPGLCLLLAACATSLPPEEIAARLPPGYYKLDCPIVYENGLALLSPVSGGMRVDLQEKIKGSFDIRLKRDGSLEFTNDEMDYPGLRRSFKGKGRMTAPGKAEGNASVWVLNYGIAGRDHRTGTWTLRPATREEVGKFEARARSLQERKRKAGFID